MALLLAGPASATPGTGVQVETLSKNTVNGVDYIVTQITVAPGGGTGWHYHPGEVFGFIKEGHDDALRTQLPGRRRLRHRVPVKEGVGPGFVHNGRNEGSTRW